MKKKIKKYSMIIISILLFILITKWILTKPITTESFIYASAKNNINNRNYSAI
jgi:hypothetical protein